MDIAITILQILTLIGISFLAMFKKNYFPKYLEEKAKNTATKEDIETITSQIEKVKQSYKIDFDKIQKKNDLIVSEIKDTRNRYNSKQFELYNDLWSSLIDLKISADDLWDSANAKNLKKFSTNLHNAKVSIEKSSLLIESSHYKDLMKIIKKLEEFEFGKKKLIILRNKTEQEINKLAEYDNFNNIIEQNRESKSNFDSLMESLKIEFTSTIRGETSNKTLERNI
jgi:hypothetical protein